MFLHVAFLSLQLIDTTSLCTIQIESKQKIVYISSLDNLDQIQLLLTITFKNLKIIY